MIPPAWMATPPEVHAALLCSGPGPGPLLAAADQWHALSSAYTDAAAELTDLMAAMQAGAWEGLAAESYAAAHTPYSAWLLRAATASAVNAAQHETTAAAYVAALAAMPTLTELAANHATHASLLATNFFGINTIAIALNEADYVRMWIQAATTMTSYAAVSAAATAAASPVDPAPQILDSASSDNPAASQNPLQGWLDLLQPILKSLGIEDGVTAHDPMVSNALTDFVAHILQNFGVNWDPAAGMLNGHVYDYYSNAAQPIWYLARSLELFEDFLYMSQDPTQALRAVQYLIALALFDWPTHIAQLTTTISQSAPLLAVAGAVVAAPAGAAGGLAGFAGLAGLADLPQPASMPAPVPVAAGAWSAAGMGPPLTAPTTATAPTPSPTATTVTGSAPPPSPPAAGGAGLVAPYAVGPPGIGFGSETRTGAGAQRNAPEPDSATAAAAAQATARSRARARRQRRTALRDGHGTLEMDVQVDPEWAASTGSVASERSAGLLGFAGTESILSGGAAGLATVGSHIPMLPATWGAGARRER